MRPTFGHVRASCDLAQEAFALTPNRFMTSFRQSKLIRPLAALFAAAPFVAASLRYAGTGSDVRMFWMAAAALIGTALAKFVAKTDNASPKVIRWLTMVVLAIATLLAGLTAILLGATAVAGIWPVAFVFGVCFAVSFALFTLSQSDR